MKVSKKEAEEFVRESLKVVSEITSLPREKVEDMVHVLHNKAVNEGMDLDETTIRGLVVNAFFPDPAAADPA